MNDAYQINNNRDLRAIIGDPIERVKQKIYTSLDESMKAFIRRSPLLFLSTQDARGQADISPKGDAPGFVNIDENGNLLIPDRPGNKLIFGFENILQNNNIGLIFVVPNMRETLRVKGQATLSNDPELLQQLSAMDKPALLVTQVQVQECFFHCGKAMIRSNMWKPENWSEQGESLMVNSIAQKNNADQQQLEEIEKHIEKSYRDNLY